MEFKATIRAAASSYMGSLSAVATGLLSIKLATHFLTPEEFGLWSFTMQTVGYFMLMDLGVSNSIGRLFGDPLATGEPKKIHSWFSMSLLTLVGQALLILSAGYFLKPFVLRWFEIPPHLLERASQLWMAFLFIQAIGLVFKVCFAILHAQNRAYWTSNVQILGSWFGLAAFFLMLNSGWGVLSYAWSSGISMLVSSLGGAFAVSQGHTKFRFSLSGISRHEVWKLFSFSSSIFVLGLASQVYFASQGLVATKLLGLEAAAVLAVTARASGIAMQSIWKPFDAFSPRWQVAYCSGDLRRVRREFTLMSRFTILIAAAACSAVAIVNQPFVLWWTKPSYFGGISLSLLLCLFMIVQGINRCFVAPFTLTVKMKAYTWVSVSSVGSAVCLMVVFSQWFGLMGIPMGLILGDLLFPMWFYLRKGSQAIGVQASSILLKDFYIWVPLTALAFFLALLIPHIQFSMTFFWLLAAVGCAGAVSAPLVIRAVSLLKQLKNSHDDHTSSAPSPEA